MSNSIRYLQRSRQAVLPGSRRALTFARTKSASFGLLGQARVSKAPALGSAQTATDRGLDLPNVAR
ncbi:hypothetical protein [Cryobacterium sp. MLB-32]|uniref:hypothetical protein n=1 Tax=Cryobacterium sp. MLB-32 TaxID=1529318 RepID=UPI0012DFF0B0|nr:hypothetical protein [Cryobacterium sp. MLB-32]